MGEIEHPEQSEDETEPCGEEKITGCVGDTVQEEVNINVWFQKPPLEILVKKLSPKGPNFQSADVLGSMAISYANSP
jgi:hypothetical protein